MEQQKARYVNPFTDFGFKKIFGEVKAAEIAAFTPEEVMWYQDSLKVYRDIKNSPEKIAPLPPFT